MAGRASSSTNRPCAVLKKRIVLTQYQHHYSADRIYLIIEAVRARPHNFQNSELRAVCSVAVKEDYMELVTQLPDIRMFSLRLWEGLHAHLAGTLCRTMHRSISRPVNGKYRCWTCLREFPVSW